LTYLAVKKMPVGNRACSDAKEIWSRREIIEALFLSFPVSLDPDAPLHGAGIMPPLRVNPPLRAPSETQWLFSLILGVGRSGTFRRGRPQIRVIW